MYRRGSKNWYSVIIFDLAKLWKAKFFILCVLYFRGAFTGEWKLVTLGSERINSTLDVYSHYNIRFSWPLYLSRVTRGLSLLDSQTMDSKYTRESSYGLPDGDAHRDRKNVPYSAVGPWPFTPKNGQFQIYPAASPGIQHHTVWRTCLLSLLRWKKIILPILTTSLLHFSLEGWENVLFELGSERNLTLSLPSSKRTFSEPLIEKYVSDAVRIW